MRSLKKQGGWIQFVAAGISALGALKGSSAKKRAGRAAKARGKDQNRFSKIAAIQTEASGQIQAREEKRQGELIASRAIAVAAAGGYSDDITGLLEDIDGEANYRASIALFEAGTEAERQRFEGEQAEKYGADTNLAASASARNTLLSGIGSGISAYGRYKSG